MLWSSQVDFQTQGWKREQLTPVTLDSKHIRVLRYTQWLFLARPQELRSFILCILCFISASCYLQMCNMCSYKTVGGRQQRSTAWLHTRGNSFRNLWKHTTAPCHLEKTTFMHKTGFWTLIHRWLTYDYIIRLVRRMCWTAGRPLAGYLSYITCIKASGGGFSAGAGPLKYRFKQLRELRTWVVLQLVIRRLLGHLFGQSTWGQVGLWQSGGRIQGVNAHSDRLSEFSIKDIYAK